MKNTLIILSFILSLVSCKKDEKPTYLTDAERANLVSDTTSGVNVSNAINNSGNLTSAVSSVVPTTNGSSSAPLVLNPEHGKPGHRCEIAVGAPLNSAPRNSAQVQPTISTQKVSITPSQVSPVKTKTPAGINPPHGEPGHRCDIAVGAPLNSKPINTKPAVTTVNTPAKQTTAPGMNPPHGEPGHRCDIPVGEPLNSKPATANTTPEKQLPATVAAPTDN